MKIFLSLLIGVLVVVVARSDRLVCLQRKSTNPNPFQKSFSLSPLDWRARVSGPFDSVSATKKDLLVHLAFDSVGLDLNIRRRNSAGKYVHVANFTDGPSAFSSMITNGKWVALLSNGIPFPHFLFSVDANNKVSAQVSSIQLVVSFCLTIPSLDMALKMLPMEISQSKLMNTAKQTETGLRFPAPSSWEKLDRHPHYQVSDTHLILYESVNVYSATVKLYERLADRSWSLFDTLLVNDSRYIVQVFNNMDTLVMARRVRTTGDNYGLADIYTKINGEWIQQQFTTESVGYRANGWFGTRATFLKADTLLLSAPFEGGIYGYGSVPVQSGKVLMLTRNSSSGEWEPVLDLTGGGIFGFSVAINDHDLVVGAFSNSSSLPKNLYTAPLCFTQPINATCFDRQVDNCTDVTPAELYTINDPQCGAVSVNFSGFIQLNDEALSASFTFARSSSFSCNVTVTCPKNASAPALPPVSPVAPPVASPTENVSSANAIQFSFISLFASVLLLILSKYE